MSLLACGTGEEPTPADMSGAPPGMDMQVVTSDMRDELQGDLDVIEPVDMKPVSEAGIDMNVSSLFDLGGATRSCAPGDRPEILDVSADSVEFDLSSMSAVTVTVKTRCFTLPITSVSVNQHSPKRVLSRVQVEGDRDVIDVVLSAEELDGIESEQIELDVSVSSMFETLSLQRALALRLVREG